MNKTPAIVIALLLGISNTGWAEQTTPNGLGAFVNFIETDEVGYGISYNRDITDKDQIFILLETFSYTDSENVLTPDYVSESKVDGDGNAATIGYLRKVIASTIDLYLGPGIGIQQLEGDFKSTQYDNSRSGYARASIDSDPDYFVTVNAKAEYKVTNTFSLFGNFAYGYIEFGDSEWKFSTGNQGTLKVDGDNDTYWNFYLGAQLNF